MKKSLNTTLATLIGVIALQTSHSQEYPQPIPAHYQLHKIIAYEDFDGDKHPEHLMARSIGSCVELYVQKIGNSQLLGPKKILTIIPKKKLNIGLIDYDNDGDLDIRILNNKTDNSADYTYFIDNEKGNYTSKKVTYLKQNE